MTARPTNWGRGGGVSPISQKLSHKFRVPSHSSKYSCETAPPLPCKSLAVGNIVLTHFALFEVTQFDLVKTYVSRWRHLEEDVEAAITGVVAKEDGGPPKCHLSIRLLLLCLGNPNIFQVFKQTGYSQNPTESIWFLKDSFNINLYINIFPLVLNDILCVSRVIEHGSLR